MLQPDKSMTNIILYLNKLIRSNKKIDSTKTIAIFGSPRSGTTWLMEILRLLPNYTYLSEPINPIFFPEAFDLGFTSRTYLSPEVDWPAGEKYLHEVFQGQIMNHPIPKNLIKKNQSYPLNHSSFKQKFLLNEFEPRTFINYLFANKLIVKFVRLNRLLPWISQRFQLRGTIYVIRHPCAVVASQLQTGFCGYHPPSPPYTDIYPSLNQILYEASEIKWLNNDILNNLKEIKTREEILAAAWCLDNIIPLSFAKLYPWTIVVYEKLIKEGDKELQRIFHELGEKTISPKIYEYLTKPSKLTVSQEKNKVIQKDLQLKKWKKYLTEEQIQRILTIVYDFGLDFFSEDTEPDYNRMKLVK